MFAPDRAVISIEAIDRGGLSSADDARALNLTPSEISKLILPSRKDTAIKDGVKDVLNMF